MRVLVLAPTYPHPGFPFSGVFNERCAKALRELCDHVEVLVPRPFVPRVLAVHPRWKAYSKIVGYEERDGISIHRPPLYRIPRVGSAFWSDVGAFLCCSKSIRELHRRSKFDAIISFDLLGAGGLAWRAGKFLGIPACGWATGSDVRVSATSSSGKVVLRALKNLDLVFYQSTELLQMAAKLVNTSPLEMMSRNHMVLPRGIPVPCLSKESKRKLIRDKWGVGDSEIIVVSLGRITRQKGSFELLDAILYAYSFDKRIRCILVGSMPEFDETELIKKRVARDPVLEKTIRILPVCNPDEIWDVLSGADVFAFPSHKEGMPNSLLEAMAIGLPSVAFAIPPVEELDAGTCSLMKVPPFDTRGFAEAIVQLSGSSEKRKIIGANAKKRIMERFMITTNMTRAIETIGKLINKNVSDLS